MADIINCAGCGKPVPEHISNCPYCKKPCKPSLSITTKSEPLPPHLDSSCRYPSLKIISTIIKIVAVIPLIASIFTFFTGLPIISIISGIVASIIWGILTWAISESIQIFIDIEENQRKMIDLLDWKNR